MSNRSKRGAAHATLARIFAFDPGDKCISEGSLHVGADFYRGHLDGLRDGPSVVYVLPETDPVEHHFGPATAGHRDFIAHAERGAL